MRNTVILFLFVAFGLGGCTSVPPSTMIRPSHVSPETVSTLDPSGIEVKLSFPLGYKISPDETQLVLYGEDSSGSSIIAKIPLSEVKVAYGKRGGVFSTSPVTVNTYWFVLSRQGVSKLREAQNSLLETKHLSNAKFSVTWEFSACPSNPVSTRVWSELKLRQKQPFFTIMDGKDIWFPKGFTCS